MDKFAKSLLQSGNTTISNILLKNYPKLGMNSDQLVLYLQIKRSIDMGSYFPDINELTDSTGMSSAKIYQILHELIQNKLMKIKTLTDKRGQSFDIYDFSLMYDKLSELNQNIEDEHFDNKDVNVETKESDRKETFNKIESEFGRPLSPIEIETINQWINDDHYDTKMIQLALRESVLNQVYSLKYIDRILVNWEKANIKTPADVEKNRHEREIRRNKNNSVSTNNNDKPEIPIFKIDK
ncbi:DnaD domain-containing protein [Apilactobacillus apinorum]|uniref:DnaD domain-containing protein n=1 Tax=Apilactobacillus apinorum TaxID=1218495 RepID=UPI0006B6261B|nr:DnaD domain protein [Apilactobacillus apinorum]KOY68810.1 DNA replication protein DnaD [Apilactobacillus apinorum]CAI2665039.1 DNA replication protein DnaD [Apilactobacillus apinorum]